MPVSYSGTAITWPDSSTTTSGWTGFKNRIINGAMVIDQRNAGASVSTNDTNGFYYLLDRWNYYVSQANKFTVQRNAGSVTLPTGFTNYLGATSSATTSVGASDLFMISQFIEGFNTSDLDFGTANAKTVTLSFWVRSSLTGTFGGSLQNSAVNRAYPFTYTISAANTWEQKSITIAGDTTGTWIGGTNGIGLRVTFGLGVGSTYSGTAGSWSGNQYWSATGATNVVSTNGATFYITGVQLERGSTASSFEYRPYGTELQLCQRYFTSFNSITTNAGDSCFAYGMTAGDATYHSLVAFLPVTMRSAPTITLSGTQISDGWNYGVTVTSLWYTNQNIPQVAKFGVRTGSGATAYRGAFLAGIYNSTTDYLNLSAEL